MAPPRVPAIEHAHDNNTRRSSMTPALQPGARAPGLPVSATACDLPAPACIPVNATRRARPLRSPGEVPPDAR
ncbi:hypothetical protein TUM18999_42820 [Pseudomonas tohonis]|uniref:Uncharacterized protein n=2 Tax=Pseudomonas tohonis TaxID=2725477 RepID=A0A6J4EC95_9PSED|nr:hypothetical protein TUM18999_42820 [Pseudomonas tohonis]